MRQYFEQQMKLRKKLKRLRQHKCQNHLQRTVVEGDRAAYRRLGWQTIREK
jgi:hypothetical protein